MDDFVDVGTGSPLEYTPNGTIGDLKHLMVGQKVHDEFHGELSESRSRTGPKGCPQGEKKALFETISEPVEFQEFVDGGFSGIFLLGQFVKAHDVEGHFPMEWVGQVPEVSE